MGNNANKTIAGLVSSAMVFSWSLSNVTLDTFQSLNTINATAVENNSTVVATDYCGSAMWTLYSDGTLTISGSDDIDTFYGIDSYCDKVKSIIIENGITSIKNCAFYNRFQNAISITIPDSVTTIEDYALGGLISLSSIEIPKNVEYLAYDIFSGCTNLKTVTFAEGSKLTTIYDCAFIDCPSLESIVIPNTVTNIGNNVFKNCTKLSTVYLPNSTNTTNSSIPTNTTQIKYALNGEQNAINITSISGSTKVDIPATIMGYNVISVPSEYQSLVGSHMDVFSSYTSNNNATCTTDGTKDAICSICGNTSTVLDENNLATGHSYGEPTYTWSDDKSSCTATFVCANDNEHVETITNDSSSSTTDATCTTDGITTYTATFNFNGKEYYTSTSESIDAVGHNYGEPTYTWSNDKSSCTAKFICANDENHVETVDCPITFETMDGQIVYTAVALFNGKEYTSSKEVSLSSTVEKYTSIDLLRLKKHILNIGSPDEDISQLDLNQDNAINVIDVILLKQRLLKQ